MSLSQLPLSYCTNVHPGRSVGEVEAGLDRYTIPIRAHFGQPLAAGLWLAKPVVTELLATPDGVRRFAEGFRKRKLTCHTLNAFPFGDFHSERVKENVYLPDWASDDRLQYTIQCAKVLAELLPEGGEGSISTLPLGFKAFKHPADFLDRAAHQLIAAARALDVIYRESGKLIRLAVEPEPLCVLETTPEAIEFFHLLITHAHDNDAEEIVCTHIGLCYDICHQAVEFEDVAESIRALDEADIRINKVHISCALQLDNPGTNLEGREALRQYVEPRYLHQTTAQIRNGKIVRETDLSDAFITNPPPAFADAPAWRIHFHVPVNAHHLGRLSTTRADLIMALTEVAGLDYAPHLEVETYTWEVLPGAEPRDLVDGLAKELTSTEKLILELRS